MNSLLGREEISPHKPSLESQTPLLFAAWNRREGVMEMLLGLEEVNPDKLGYSRQNPALRCRFGWAPGSSQKCCSGEKRSTPTSQITTAEHRSRMPLGMDMSGENATETGGGQPWQAR